MTFAISKELQFLAGYNFYVKLTWCVWLGVNSSVVIIFKIDIIWKSFMSLSDLPNLWVPLALLGLIVIAAVFFSRSN
jgi:hypothetical protein